ncbi:MAG: hypothetical protein PV340_01600 [Wolbachia sp.]|nr:hypothetical protein [Wolbachia sp.]MDD9336570.1 hypothetical protein [Wolbachia sp.]
MKVPDHITFCSTVFSKSDNERSADQKDQSETKFVENYMDLIKSLPEYMNGFNEKVTSHDELKLQKDTKNNIHEKAQENSPSTNIDKNAQEMLSKHFLLKEQLYKRQL